MKAKELLRLLPESELEFLAAESKVDKQVKKLHGITIFQLILFSMLHADKASLRVMETLFHSMEFRIISGLKDETTTRFNSIRDRIATINSDFFERLFASVFDRFNKHFKEEKELIRYDSTMIAISSSLVEWGMKVGSKTDKVQLKYTVGMKGSFPCQVTVYDEAESLCEDKTITPTILSNMLSATGIVVFDRGVHARKSYRILTEQNRLFVTRVNLNVRYRTMKKLEVEQSQKETVSIHDDLIVQLITGRGEWEPTPLRLIKGIIKATGEEIYFLTNIKDLSAFEIAAIYRKRWDIEVLFRFLKQHLNLSHLVARNANGIRVMVYMTLILAILLIAYRKLYKVSSFKIAKLRFSLDIEANIVEQIVLLCGGDPLKMKHLFNDS